MWVCVGNVYGRTTRWDPSGIMATVYKNAGDEAGARGYFVRRFIACLRGMVNITGKCAGQTKWLQTLVLYNQLMVLLLRTIIAIIVI